MSIPKTVINEANIMAVKSMFNGSASQDQQQIFLDILANYLCRFGSRAPDANVERWLGRREVWLDLLELNYMQKLEERND